MKPGEKFELECLDYLKNNYLKDGVEYIHHDTADSTSSDIEVFINGKSSFFIEVKDKNAQSGQFVLLPDDNKKEFIFSSSNKSEQNEMTDFIINYINSDYEAFNEVGTEGKILDISPEIFTKWIIGHYKEKDVKYIISKGSNMIICPIEKFGDYFDVSSIFRPKKSGSDAPSKKYVDGIIEILKKDYNITGVEKIGSKVFVKGSVSISKARFEAFNKTFYLSPKETPGYFEVRQLSNTNNKNVIFSIKVKQEQNQKDLSLFISELN